MPDASAGGSVLGLDDGGPSSSGGARPGASPHVQGPAAHVVRPFGGPTRLVALAAAALLLLLQAPTGSSAAEIPPAELEADLRADRAALDQQVAAARARAAAAEDSLQALAFDLVAERDELVAIERRLADASARLRTLDGQLVLAERELEHRQEAAARAADRADRAAEAVVEAERALAVEEQRLDDQAATSFMHGTTARPVAMLQMLEESEDPGNLAADVHLIGVVLDGQVAVIRRVDQLRRDMEEASRVAVEERAAADAAAALAADAVTVVEELRAEAVTVRAERQADLDRQQVVLASLEVDVREQEAVLASVSAEVNRLQTEREAVIAAQAAAAEAAARAAAEQRAAEQRAAEQRAAEQRAAEQRAAEQRAAEQRAAEQQAAEQQAAEESTSTAAPTSAPPSSAPPPSTPAPTTPPVEETPTEEPSEYTGGGTTTPSGPTFGVPAGGSPSGPCPVDGAVAGRDFTNDWGYPRSGGRYHEGTDVFASFGTPVRAMANGSVRALQYTDGGLGGLYVSIWVGPGESWYYAHLLSVAPGLSVGAPVVEGQLLGTVGNSGNARGTPPHLHIGNYVDGVARNPYPLLEQRCR